MILEAPFPTTIGKNSPSVEICISTLFRNPTKEGAPLQSVEAEIVSQGNWPERPAGKSILAAFDFGPDGATFTPAMTITLEYDPAQIPEGVAEGDLVIASLNGETGEWEYPPASVNTENNTISVEVSHFTIFTIACDAPPSPAPDEADQSNVWVIIGPILGVLAVCGAIYYFVRRRK